MSVPVKEFLCGLLPTLSPIWFSLVYAKEIPDESVALKAVKGQSQKQNNIKNKQITSKLQRTLETQLNCAPRLPNNLTR